MMYATNPEIESMLTVTEVKLVVKKVHTELNACRIQVHFV